MEYAKYHMVKNRYMTIEERKAWDSELWEEYLQEPHWENYTAWEENNKMILYLILFPNSVTAQIYQGIFALEGRAL